MNIEDCNQQKTNLYLLSHIQLKLLLSLSDEIYCATLNKSSQTPEKEW